jgi:hypothetical protein
VLQYLCVEDIASAHGLLSHFAARDATLSNTPLLHFASFVTELCERSAAAAPLFDVLRAKYAPVFARDPGLDAYLDRIAALYFGRAQPKSFLDGLMGQIDAKPAKQSVPKLQPSPTAAPAAAAPATAAPAEPHADVPMASLDVD